MLKWQPQIEKRDEERRIYNAFSAERFFEYDYDYYKVSTTNASLDKLSVIDEIISANISALTHRLKQNDNDNHTSFSRTDFHI